jgi:hypothetical protein
LFSLHFIGFTVRGKENHMLFSRAPSCRTPPQ